MQLATLQFFIMSITHWFILLITAPSVCFKYPQLCKLLGNMNMYMLLLHTTKHQKSANSFIYLTIVPLQETCSTSLFSRVLELLLFLCPKLPKFKHQGHLLKNVSNPEEVTQMSMNG